MFCPECGNEIPEEAVFCPECGVAIKDYLIENESKSEAVSENKSEAISADENKPAPMSKKTKIIIGEAVVLGILLFAVSSYAKKQFTPEKTAYNFAADCYNGDYEKAYDYLDIAESRFVNKELFAKSMEYMDDNEEKIESMRFIKVSPSTLGLLNDDKNKVTTYLTAYIKYKGSKEKENGSVALSKSTKKKLLFFDNWKMDSDRYVNEDFYISVPKGATVTVEGIKLGENDLAKDTKDNTTLESIDRYCIPSIIDCEVNIEVSKKGFKTQKELVSTKKSYFCGRLDLDDDTKKSLVKQCGEDFKAIYKAAFAGNEYTDVSDMFNEPDQHKDEYEDFVAKCQLRSDGTGTKGVVFDDIDMKLYSYSEDDKLVAYINIDTDYTVYYVSQNFWSGEKKDEVSQDNFSRRIKYVYTGDEWLIDSDEVFDNLYY